MKKPMISVSLILFILTIAYCPIALSYGKGIFVGSVQFPKTLTDIPHFRIYYGGNKIKSDIHVNSKKVVFSIPEDKRRTSFTVIITESIQFASEDNTIMYLKLAKNQSYKFFSIQLIKMENAIIENDKRKDPTYEWIIEQQHINLLDGRIPDDALIICMNPNFIQGLEGGNSVEFPKIIVKSDVVQLAGSESKFEDSYAKLLLSSLDTDAIHANIHEEVKQNNQRSRITLIT
jgi:hypothetical protein